jgi:Fic family protein
VHRHPFGRYINNSVSGEIVKAYMPDTLPPNPPLEMPELYSLLDQANLAIGRLDGISINVPDISLFLYMYIRKEAVLSSQIEGTQSTLTDLLMYENNEPVGVPIDDVVEVSNYVAAMNHGLKRIADGFPLCLRLIREMHEILLSNGRGRTKQPGVFRTSQNWIGGTRPGNASFVPPPWENVADLLSNLESFWNVENGSGPTLLKAGLAHFQFETIHPFLDGNGRLGRLLITFILCVDGVLTQPLLYLSLYFKVNRQSYYEHLQYTREKGDLEEWLRFFLKGIIYTAEQAVKTIQQTLELLEKDRQAIQSIGKSARSALIIHDLMKKIPIADANRIVSISGLTLPTVNYSIKNLIQLGIVSELTGKARNKIYKYTQYLDILSDGI